MEVWVSDGRGQSNREQEYEKTKIEKLRLYKIIIFIEIILSLNNNVKIDIPF